MDNNLVNILTEKIGADNVRQNEPMSAHSSMKCGGCCDLFLTPRDSGQLSYIIRTLNDAGIPWYVIGNASNVLFRDEGYRGAVIQIKKGFEDINVSGNCVTAQAGISLRKLADRILEESLTGFEFASGIPGSLGGAVTMNAGAYGGEMKDVLLSITAMDRNGSIVKIPAQEADLAYRHSIFSDGSYIVLEAELKLEYGNRADIKAMMDDLNCRRADKQPLEYPSCGSVFKRPEGYFAGKLIMDSGLAGERCGGVSVSEKHCGFIINDRGGTASDVLELIRRIQERVKDRFGVELECEVKVL